MISGLTAGTRYRLRLLALSADGWRSSATRAFTVPRIAASAARRPIGASLPAAAPGSATGAAAPRAPGSMLWGAQVGTQFTGNSAPWDMNAVADFAQISGKAPAIVPFNLPFEGCSSPGNCYPYDFPAAQMNNVNAYGAITMLNWSSMVTPLTTDQPQFTLQAVASGAYDDYIRSFAQAAAAWGHPFLLRFDWEMNGNWFPWAEGANGNQPGSFVAAWRHVHDIFAAAGASNAKWVWCPNVDFMHRFVSDQELYPGDGYVDWTCLDGYNFGTSSTPGGWMSFDQIFSSSYRAITQIAPSKPMIIGETASVEAGGSKAAWITDMFSQLATGYPNIRALVWFDATDGGDVWPLETSPSAGQAFAAGIAQPAFATNSYRTATTITP